MKFTLFLTSFLASAVAAVPVDEPGVIRTSDVNVTDYAGVAPVVTSLDTAAAGVDAASGDFGVAACCGVWICDQFNWVGNCYWACYPISTPIYPDPYFQTHIGSWAPDVGCSCFMSRGSDPNMSCAGNLFQWPGGNFGPDCANNVSRFYCVPSG
ncbi:hypothetical protein B0T14DRAFT_565634 [Immersiella caudata]|uniref:Uncharacterized protein n=1 Tax=Immersiella caudata TaxID=314043 RepID=A0AA39WZA0_9PEZI|nr:hypothetical protein B0T14DRAFT_565634 [Immersiella caudata]